MSTRSGEPSQSAGAVILVRPTGFGYDHGTAGSNAFQRPVQDRDTVRKAEVEFDRLLEALHHCGIGTTVLEPVSRLAPNAIFPNNWFSTHADGTVVLYPMLTPSRRAERDPQLAATLAAEGYRVDRVLDLSGWEEEDLVLEGTGSLVLDRRCAKAFACLSPRTNRKALNRWCEQMGYGAVPFLATMDGTPNGQPVYHTNVAMCIGAAFAVICLEAMPHSADRTRVEHEVDNAERELVPIHLGQMHRFVGNMLEIHGEQGPCILLSSTAHRSLEPAQRRALERLAQLVPVDIPTIETVGGGSVRCMLAENYLETYRSV